MVKNNWQLTHKAEEELSPTPWTPSQSLHRMDKQTGPFQNGQTRWTESTVEDHSKPPIKKGLESPVVCLRHCSMFLLSAFCSARDRVRDGDTGDVVTMWKQNIKARMRLGPQ